MTPVRWSPRPVRTLARRVARSPLAADLRASASSAFGSAVFCAGLVLGLLLVVVTRGTFLDWSGFHPIPGGDQ